MTLAWLEKHLFFVQGQIFCALRNTIDAPCYCLQYKRDTMQILWHTVHSICGAGKLLVFALFAKNINWYISFLLQTKKSSYKSTLYILKSKINGQQINRTLLCDTMDKRAFVSQDALLQHLKTQEQLFSYPVEMAMALVDRAKYCAPEEGKPYNDTPTVIPGGKLIVQNNNNT